MGTGYSSEKLDSRLAVLPRQIILGTDVRSLLAGRGQATRKAVERRCLGSRGSCNRERNRGAWQCVRVWNWKQYGLCYLAGEPHGEVAVRLSNWLVECPRNDWYS